MYANVNDIDLYVGGLAEAGIFINKTNAVGNNFRLNGSVVGSTFGCLLAKQFVKLKKGDRFFYENAPNLALGTNSTAFTTGIKHKNNIHLKGYLLNFLFFQGQLSTIKNMTISGLICMNFDINAIKPSIFFLVAK